MLYVKCFCENGYCGCDMEDVLTFEEGTSEIEIDECIRDIAIDHAESFEYVATGWGNDFESDEDRDFYYENIDYSWKYITKEEYDNFNK